MTRTTIRTLLSTLALLIGTSISSAADVASLIQGLEASDTAVRIRSIDQLADHGAGAATAVNALVKQLKDPNAEIRWRVERALGSIRVASPEVISGLEAALSDEAPRVRAYACHALGQLGEAAKGSVTKIVTLIKDSDQTVRREAMRSVRGMKLGPTVTIPLIIDALKTMPASEVGPVLHSFAEMGEAAVPGVIEAFKHEEARYWACLVLGELGPQGKGAVSAAVPVLKESDAHLRFEALMALAQVGPGAASAVPAIVESLGDSELAVRNAALYALGSIGPYAKSAESRLKQISTEKQPSNQALAAWALAEIDPQDTARRTAALPLLVATTQDNHPRLRRFALSALGHWKATDEATLAALAKSLGDEDAGNVTLAATALAEVGAAALPAVTAVIDRAECKRGAIETLGRMGAKAASVAGRLRELTRDAAPENRVEAMMALAHVAPKDPATIVALIERLESDAELDVKHAAVDGLVHLGLTAESTAALKKAQQSGSPVIRAAASDALEMHK